MRIGTTIPTRLAHAARCVLLSAALLAPAAAQTESAHAPAPPLAAASLELVGEARLLLERGDAAGCVERLESGLAHWPADEAIWLALLDAELQRGRYAAALRRCADAQAALRGSPGVALRGAQARFALGDDLGETRVHTHPDGKPGYFERDCLLIERRGSGDRFVCCGPQAALYQVRKALDGGLDDPAAHLLHARIWLRLGRPEVALPILRHRRTALLASAGPDVFDTFADAALGAGAVDEYLAYSRVRAEQSGPNRAAVLRKAYVEVARRSAQTGQPDLQIAFLYRAAELPEPPAELLLDLADALWDAERREACDDWYRRALAAAPNHPQRERILERLAR